MSTKDPGLDQTAATAGMKKSSAIVAMLSHTHQFVFLSFSSGHPRCVAARMRHPTRHAQARAAQRLPSPIQNLQPRSSRLQLPQPMSPPVAATVTTCTPKAVAVPARTKAATPSRTLRTGANRTHDKPFTAYPLDAVHNILYQKLLHSSMSLVRDRARAAFCNHGTKSDPQGGQEIQEGSIQPCVNETIQGQGTDRFRFARRQSTNECRHKYI